MSPLKVLLATSRNEVQAVSLRQVKAWKEEKGFGFLIADDGTEVCKAQGNSGYRYVQIKSWTHCFKMF